MLWYKEGQRCWPTPVLWPKKKKVRKRNWKWQRARGHLGGAANNNDNSVTHHWPGQSNLKASAVHLYTAVPAYMQANPTGCTKMHHKEGHGWSTTEDYLINRSDTAEKCFTLKIEPEKYSEHSPEIQRNEKYKYFLLKVFKYLQKEKIERMGRRGNSK